MEGAAGYQRGPRLEPNPDPLGGQHFFVEVPMPGFQPWTYEQCPLYLARVKLIEEGRTLDEMTFRFGRRDIGVKDRRYRLNGKSLWLRGSNLVFEWNWGDTITGHELDYLVTEAREMSMNSFRTHTQPPPRLWADSCDEHGTMILAEFPVLYSFDFALKADSIEKAPVTWKLPGEEGSYWLTARMTGMAGRPVLSQPELCDLKTGKSRRFSRVFPNKATTHPLVSTIKPEWLIRWNGYPGTVGPARTPHLWVHRAPMRRSGPRPGSAAAFSLCNWTCSAGSGCPILTMIRRLSAS